MSEEKKIEFEQYKIFIDSAEKNSDKRITQNNTEKNSDKRITQNNIYLTINLAFVSYICTQNFEIKQTITMIIIGILICLIWFFTINNYSKRNKVKFEIINESEYGKLYKEEWKRINVLTALTTYEKISSLIFIILYLALFVIKLI